MHSSSRPPATLGTRQVLDPGDRFRSAATEPIPPSLGRPILGLVTFPGRRGERAEAILDVEGRWRCPKLPVLDRVLNILFAPGSEAIRVSPFGHDELERVAAWLNGTVRARPTGGARDPRMRGDRPVG